MRDWMFFIPVVLIFAVSVWISRTLDSIAERHVKSGERILVCEFRNGSRVVSPDKIEYYHNGRWYFTNGSAKRCKITGGK